jgi:putative ABC transport system permease protein
VIIGEALVGGQHHLALAIVGAVMGSVLFRLVQGLVLRAGFDPNDFKLINAVFVFLALVLPNYLPKIIGRVAKIMAWLGIAKRQAAHA